MELVTQNNLNLPNIAEAETTFKKQLELAANNLPVVTDQKSDAEALGFLKTLKNWLAEYKAQRMALTKQFDAIKKEKMELEKQGLEIIDMVTGERDGYANQVQQLMEITNYSSQFETMLLATLKSIALDHAGNNRPATQIDLSKVLTKPYQQHLIKAHIELCTEWQPKATKLYLTYFNEAPKTVEEAQEEKAITQSVAQMEIGQKQAEVLTYKPKGSQTKITVEVTHPDALKRILGLYFESLGSGVLTDKNLDFASQWAAKLPEEQLAKLAQYEGIHIISTVKTSTR